MSQNLIEIVNVKVTKKMAIKAWNKSKEQGTLTNSIRSGEGNLIGYIAEEAVKSFFGIEDTNDNCFDYDFIYKNEKYEVKAKETKYYPELHYEASIADYNTRQKCDYYVFTRVLKHETDLIPKNVFIMGYMPKEEYMQVATFKKRGTRDTSNNWLVKKDCWNIPYFKCYDIRKKI